MHAGVFGVRLEILDVAHQDELDVAAAGCLDPAHVFARTDGGHELTQKLVHRCWLQVQPPAEPLQAARQPVILIRLEHVVDRTMVERLDGVGVVGGQEDDVAGAGQPAGHV